MTKPSGRRTRELQPLAPTNLAIDMWDNRWHVTLDISAGALSRTVDLGYYVLRSTAEEVADEAIQQYIDDSLSLTVHVTEVNITEVNITEERGKGRQP